MIIINSTPNADSRTGGKDIDFAELVRSTDDHMGHVKLGMEFFGRLMETAGERHDWTKKAYMEEFHKDLTTLEPGDEFKDGKWYQMHISRERHHLNSMVPDDVNLVDIFEFITDCVMAGMSRAGKVSDIALPDEVLRNAFNNTVERLKGNVMIGGMDL